MDELGTGEPLARVAVARKRVVKLRKAIFDGFCVFWFVVFLRWFVCSGKYCGGFPVEFDEDAWLGGLEEDEVGKLKSQELEEELAECNKMM